tara:strand:+ start:12478 stop:13110 length:633 start_codon:yes stop_codon:yes gene_type:complete
MNIIKVLIFILVPSKGLVISDIFSNRRNLIANSIFASSFNQNDYVPVKKNVNIQSSIDYYAHWSIYGLVPPPIEKSITQQELTREIENKNIISLQIAVQHDCVIATTVENHRLSCLIKDKEFNTFIEQFRDDDNSIPFTVLPIDKNKQKLRHFAQGWLGLYIVRFLVYELPNNIRLLNECNSTMTTREKMLYLLQNQNDIMEVFRNYTKS